MTQGETSRGKAGKGEQITWIRRCNWVLLLVLSAASFFLFDDIEISLGVMIGGVVSVVNFVAVSRFGASLLGGGTNKAALSAKIIIKLLLLMGTVIVVVLYFPVDPIAFLVGISISVFSICIGTLVSMFKSPTSNPESTDA